MTSEDAMGPDLRLTESHPVMHTFVFVTSRLRSPRARFPVFVGSRHELQSAVAPIRVHDRLLPREHSLRVEGEAPRGVRSLRVVLLPRGPSAVQERASHGACEWQFGVHVTEGATFV